LIVFPLSLVAERPLFEVELAWIVFFLLLGAGIIIMSLRRRSSRTTFSLVIFAITLVPVISETIVRGEAYGEHNLYGAVAGLVLVLLALIYEGPLGRGAPSASPTRFRYPLLAGLVAISLVFASLTARRHMDWENSLSISQATLEARPDNVDLRSHLGRLWVEAQDLKKAESLLEGLRSRAPDSAGTLALEGDLARAKGDAKGAAKAFGRAASLKPEDATYGVREVEALLEAGLLGLAEKRIRESLDVHPESPALIHAEGLLAERQGRPESALEAFRRSAALAPHKSEYRLDQGRVSEALGSTGEAEKAFQAAIREAPSFLEAYGELAGLLLDEGRSKEAAFLLASVVRWHPERPELGILLAEALSREGYLEKAKELYRTLLVNDPKGQKASVIREALAELEKSETAEPKAD
jgi:tetratricopeptide (TPR) repeat protein